MKFDDRRYKIAPGADLRRAYLRWRNLEGADLRKADLIGADLREADLKGANLAGANLRWAKLTEMKPRGMTESGAHLAGAIADPETIWPEEFDPVSAGVRLEPRFATGPGSVLTHAAMAIPT